LSEVHILLQGYKLESEVRLDNSGNEGATVIFIKRERESVRIAQGERGEERKRGHARIIFEINRIYTLTP
jgi:hypothetical protein